MPATLMFEGSSGYVFQTGLNVPDPPPKRYTFTDPKSGAPIDADLVGVVEGVANYREMGMPPAPESPKE